ncbi:MAG: methyltransferase family protein [Solirubrobacteraceae bacterium]
MNIPAAHTILQASLASWAAIELALRIRSRQQTGTSRPEWSVYLIFGAIALSTVLAGDAARDHLAPSTSASSGPAIAGLAMLWTGVVFRLWAILTLGRFFKFAVVIQPEHQVIQTGPYRWLRHPSYTGALIALIGLGVSQGDWLATAAMTIGPLIAFLVRIHVEEHALRQALGEEYARYATHTRNLMPGIW